MATRMVQVGELPVQLREDGDPEAPCLLLLHSLGTSAQVWDPIVASLAATFRVLRPDLRGHGGSGVTPGPYSMDLLAHDAIGLLDALGVTRAGVVGLSIGGMIAQRLAVLAPDRVSALVLMDTALQIPPANLWHERAATVRAKGMGPVLEAVISRWLTADAPAHVRDALAALFLATPPEGYAGCAEAIAGADLSEQSRVIAVPTLVLVGAEDPATPIASAEALRAAIRGARLEIIAGASHIPIAEQPAAVAGALLRFLLPDPFAIGLRTRRAVLGDAHVDRSLANATDFDRDFQHWITATAWGGVWSRPQLDRRTRSLITLAILAGLGREDEFRLHLRATRNTGATPADITDCLLHVAVYAGVPAANTAMRIAKQILAESQEA